MPVSGDQEARKCSMWCRAPRSESRDPLPGTCGRVLGEAPREGAQHGTGMTVLVVVAVNGKAAVAISVVGGASEGVEMSVCPVSGRALIPRGPGSEVPAPPFPLIVLLTTFEDVG